MRVVLINKEHFGRKSKSSKDGIRCYSRARCLGVGSLLCETLSKHLCFRLSMTEHGGGHDNGLCAV